MKQTPVDESASVQTEPTMEDRLRRRRKLIVIAVAALVIGFGVFSNYGIFTRLRLESHRRNLVDSLSSLQHVGDSLRQRATRLRYDTLEIERLARENYGMAKSNEEVFIIRKENEK